MVPNMKVLNANAHAYYISGEGSNDEVGKYDPTSERLPTASVVIAFVNEEFYTLMRTVWAVLQESPPHLLHEVRVLHLVHLAFRLCAFGAFGI